MGHQPGRPTVLLPIFEGSRVVTVVRVLAFHQCAGFDSRTRRHMWAESGASSGEITAKLFFGDQSAGSRDGTKNSREKYRGRGWPLKIKTEKSKVTFHLLLTITHFLVLKLSLASWDLRLARCCLALPSYDFRLATCFLPLAS